MGSIPLEILREIFTFLRPEDLGRVSRVCKSWKLISEEGQLWKKYCDSDTQIFLGKDPNVNWKQEVIKSEYTDILNIKEREGMGWKQPPPTGAPYDFLLKIVLAGASGVGKSSLLEHFQGKPWSDHSQQIIGSDLVVVTMVEEQITFKLQIWDHAGRERFSMKSASEYRNNFAVLLIYDVTRRETFEALDSIYEEIEKYSSPKCKIVVCANKSDLRNEEKVHYWGRDFKREEFVPDEEGLKWAQTHNRKFISMSVKQNLNLSETLRIVIGNVNTWRKVKRREPVKEQVSRLQYVKDLFWNIFKKT